MKLDKTQQYFINGLFWQEVAGVSVGGYAPKIGPVTLLHRGTTQFLFSGGFGYDMDARNFRGQMIDEHGRSLIYNIILAKGALCFSKLYERYAGNRNYALQYTLRKQPDGSWEGVYELLTGLTGPVRCFLNCIDRETVLDQANQFHEKWVAQGKRQ